jgi:hypothetical protein
MQQARLVGLPLNEKDKKRLMVVIVIVCASIGGFFLTVE